MPPPSWLLMAGHVPRTLAGGGIVRYTVELMRALAVRNDIELHVLATAGARSAIGDVIGYPERVLVLPSMPGALEAPFERWVAGRWLGDRFDIIHGVKHLVPKGAHAHTVLTVHDMLLFDRGQDYPWAKRVLLRQPYRGSIRQTDSLICVSNATRARLTAGFPKLRGQVASVLSATGSALTAASPRPVPQVDGRRFALVVGDPSPRKNLATAISAWARISDTHPDALLVLVGPPAWGAADYGPDFAKLQANNRVEQLVGVGDDELRWLYENAALVLAPSLAEGFGLPAVEALGLGAPLVTSDDAALVEVSGPAVPHLPARDVDAWARAIGDALDRGRPAAVEQGPRRTWEDVAAETVAEVLRVRPSAGGAA